MATNDRIDIEFNKFYEWALGIYEIKALEAIWPSIPEVSGACSGTRGAVDFFQENGILNLLMLVLYKGPECRQKRLTE
jgi:hypothetical protein